MRRHQRFSPIAQYQPLHIFLQGTWVAVGNNVSTTSATVITAGNNVVVTPASMTGIYKGLTLMIAGGMGTAERVLVKSVDTVGLTFTADFLYSHSGAYSIFSQKGTDLGRITVNNPGSGVTITLYNGHPANFPAGTDFAMITPTASTPFFDFGCSVDHGLFYTAAAAGNGTMGDFTLMYLDHEV